MNTFAAGATPASLALREAAAEDPGRTALEIDERRVSYGDLNVEADRLAQRLAADLDPGERVTLRANGTHELSVGLLGIQRAGLVAVPVDPTAPADRVRVILADVEPGFLLSDVAGDQDLGADVGVANPLMHGAELDPAPIDREQGELASIVYTSGSTGTPKGIMVSSAQVRAQFASYGSWGIPAGARIGGLIGGSVGYVEQLLGGTLAARATLSSYEMRRKGLTELGDWIASSRIMIISTVPTVLRQLLATLTPEHTFPSLQMVVLSGETALGADVIRLRRHLPDSAIIINSFGLTETGGIASLPIPRDAPVDPGPLPVGHVSRDLTLTIVGPDGEPVAPGERGEIVIRGIGFSAGYWRRPELTRDVFRELDDGTREVHTGDGGRLRPDGMLEHLGRLDHLIKVSGNRVELGEVEHALTRIDGVRLAAAGPYADGSGNTRLAACVVPDANARLDPRLLRAVLGRQLPGYMVPTRIAVVDSLPQLPGGKVDRSAVATISPAPEVELDEAISELEHALADIWRRVLGVERIGRHDDFFAIGGDSLGAATMFTEIEASLGFDRPVSLLAEASTIASLALALDGAAPAWDAMMPIRTEGTRPPLFVIHDGSGSVLYARGLATALGPDQPIYGMRCEGLDGTPPEEESLSELAAGYVDRVQALYPSGPYLLYGASLGGIVAMEMARQLIESGHPVPLVVLGDAPTPGPHLRPRSKAELDDHLQTLRRLRPVSRVRYLGWLLGDKVYWQLSSEGRALRRQARELELVMTRNHPVPASLRGHYAMREYGRLLGGHRAQPPFPERTVLLHVHWPGDGADRGWGPLIGASLKVVGVPGSHTDLGRESSGDYVGPLIRREIDRLFPSELAEQAYSMA